MDANIIYMQNKIDFAKIIRFIFMILLSYFSNYKIRNRNLDINFKEILKVFFITIITIVCEVVKYEINYFASIISLILVISIIFSKNEIGKSILTTIVSVSINYIISTVSIMVCFIFNKILSINNDWINLMIICIFHMIILRNVLKIKKLKYGFSFLRSENQDDYIDIFILIISSIILFSIIIISDTNLKLASNFAVVFGVFATIMFITIQKSIQLYYKQKLLVQELKETKEKLEEKTKEIKELEEENIKISKKSHTLVHKQKSLEHKIDGLIGKTEISKEEVGELTNRIKEINKELYKEKTVIELDKTEIPQIDDMLKYMQSECKKNNIDFELQIKGNIHHMINNLISKEDLETLLADHIKNAIIAINHGNNINRSILVRIGKIDECYGLYIYDSGIEFEKETIKNLGKKPSTTHENEGGTGMGFMNTFDTLKKCNASLIIEEYNEPSKDNYTKVIKIKFNNKNEFEIKTYREKSTI